MTMLLTEILCHQQDEIGRLFERLGSVDLRGEQGRQTLLLLRLRLHEHVRLEDSLLIPALEGGPELGEELNKALLDFQSGFHRIGEMLASFWDRWDPDGPLPGDFHMEMDFLFNLVRHRLRLTRQRLYPAYEHRLAAA
jgi:hypothetical protein